MVQEIRSLQKLAIFFQGLTLGAEGGGACTRYFTVHVFMHSCILCCICINNNNNSKQPYNGG